MPGGVGTTETPRSGVQIFRDSKFGMAHIYGQTRADVMFGAGYATAEERLFAMDALRRRDLELSLRLPKMDDPVDRLNRNMHFEVAKLADEPRALEWGMHMNLAARALERVGDNAVDIGEQVAFLVSGEFREFTDASHPGGVASDAT